MLRDSRPSTFNSSSNNIISSAALISLNFLFGWTILVAVAGFSISYKITSSFEFLGPIRNNSNERLSNCNRLKFKIFLFIVLALLRETLIIWYVFLFNSFFFIFFVNKSDLCMRYWSRLVATASSAFILCMFSF